jgi:hypothetical protein
VRLHRPSVLVGVGLAFVAICLVVLSPVAANAVSWPWHQNQPEATAEAKGTISCSNPVSLSGFGGSPASLILSDGATTQTLSYPFKLKSGAWGNVFRPPSYEAYLFKVRIPANEGSAHLSWSLTCWDQDGDASAKESGGFDVGRGGTSRTICNTSGFGICKGDSPTDDCLYDVFTAATGSEILDIGSKLTLTPPEGFWETAEAAVSALSPVVGVVAVCGKAVISHDGEPTIPPITTVAPIPTLSPATPLPTLPTIAPTSLPALPTSVRPRVPPAPSNEAPATVAPKPTVAPQPRSRAPIAGVVAAQLDATTVQISWTNPHEVNIAGWIITQYPVGNGGEASGQSLRDPTASTFVNHEDDGLAEFQIRRGQTFKFCVAPYGPGLDAQGNYPEDTSREGCSAALTWR